MKKPYCMIRHISSFKKLLLCLVVFFSITLDTKAQSSPFQEEKITLSDILSLYDQGLYDIAYSELTSFLSAEESPGTSPSFWAKARYYKALCNIRRKEDVLDEEILNYIDWHTAGIYRSSALLETALAYFDIEDYKKAIYYFDQLSLKTLDDSRFSEVHFKKAYSHFVRKEFDKTKTLLGEILHLQDKYFYPANYYLGMAQFFTNDYKEAVSSFHRVRSSSAYEHLIPYYIIQIYFAQEQWDDVVNYGNEVLKKQGTKKKMDIRGVLGRAYFIKEQYPQVVYHLGQYIDKKDKIRLEDFYQYGFASYQTSEYEKAIIAFKEIANEEGSMAHNANNYMADAYLKLGNKNAALAAFKRTKEMDDIPEISKEAAFNYGKLAAELGLDREALSTLKDISPVSKYFDETQSILSYILENTEDYEGAMTFIDSLEMISPVLQGTYQRLAYQYGMVKLLSDEPTKADKQFRRSLKYSNDKSLTGQAYFRLATLDNERNNYESSISWMDRYFQIRNTTEASFPEDVDISYANYIQGYNYIKLRQYPRAQQYLLQAVGPLERSNRKAMFMDALLRTGDTYFQKNDYPNALKYYIKASNRNDNGADYALYQKGIIEGLQNKPYEKLVSLDALIERFPKSSLADFAIFQNGETLLAIGEPSEAERSFEKVLSDYPSSTLRNKCLLKLGLIAFNQGNLNDAISRYKALFNYNPNAKESQEALIALEEIYVDNLSQPNAFFDFVENKAGRKLDSFTKDSISFRAGDVPFENGEYEKAISAYSKYLEKYPQGFNRITARYRRAESYAINKSFENALLDYEYVIQQNFNRYYESSLEKAALICYNALDRYKKAFDYYSLLEEITNDNQKKYASQLGGLRSAVRLEDEDAIVYMAEKLLEQESIVEADRLLAKFHLGKVQYAKGETGKSRVMLSEIADQSNGVLAAEASYLIAKSFMDENNVTQAETIVRSAIGEYKAYPYWVAKQLLLLSEILTQQDNLLQAQAAVEAVLENYTSNDDITDEANTQLKKIKGMQEEKSRVDRDSISTELKMDDGNE